MSSSIDHLDEYQLRQMELYVRKARHELAMGKALVRRDFEQWVTNAASWLLDRIESAWVWIRQQLRL